MSTAPVLTDEPLWLACPCGDPACAEVCPHQDARGPEAAACDCHCCLAAEYQVALEQETAR